MAKLIILRGTVGSGKTTVANEIQSIYPSIVIVEVDEIKMEKYKTTTQCYPEIDFPEAGKRARDYLDQGIDVIVIEPFVEPNHYAWMLQGANLNEKSPDIIPIWLKCTESTALKRKRGKPSQQIIQAQFSRYARRYQPDKELVLDTNDQPASQIALEICTHIRNTI